MRTDQFSDHFSGTARGRRSAFKRVYPKRLLANLKAFFGITLRDVALDSKPALLICYHI